jgi:hypothetical protein
LTTQAVTSRQSPYRHNGNHYCRAGDEKQDPPDKIGVIFMVALHARLLIAFMTDYPEQLSKVLTQLRQEGFAGIVPRTVMGCSPNFGYTIERPIGYGYVRNGAASPMIISTTETMLIVATERKTCRIFEASYDPSRASIRV